MQLPRLWPLPSWGLRSSSAALLGCEFPQPLASADALLPGEPCPLVSGPVNHPLRSLPNRHPSEVPQALGAPQLGLVTPVRQSCVSREGCLA